MLGLVGVMLFGCGEVFCGCGVVCGVKWCSTSDCVCEIIVIRFGGIVVIVGFVASVMVVMKSFFDEFQFF